MCVSVIVFALATTVLCPLRPSGTVSFTCYEAPVTSGRGCGCVLWDGQPWARVSSSHRSRCIGVLMRDRVQHTNEIVLSICVTTVITIT